MYLHQLHLGHRLDETSHQLLKQPAVAASDISIITGNGFSASAVNTNAGVFAQSFLELARAKGYIIAPLILATMARVAMGDEIGSVLNSRLTII